MCACIRAHGYLYLVCMCACMCLQVHTSVHMDTICRSIHEYPRPLFSTLASPHPSLHPLEASTTGETMALLSVGFLTIRRSLYPTHPQSAAWEPLCTPPTPGTWEPLYNVPRQVRGILYTVRGSPHARYLGSYIHAPTPVAWGRWVYAHWINAFGLTGTVISPLKSDILVTI